MLKISIENIQINKKKMYFYNLKFTIEKKYNKTLQFFKNIDTS